MKKIRAPFTEEQVKLLNEYQKLVIVHPFTCSGQPTPLPEGATDEKGNDVSGQLENTRSACPNEGKLIATSDGWVCPCGEYKQNWTYEAVLLIAGKE